MNEKKDRLKSFVTGASMIAVSLPAWWLLSALTGGRIIPEPLAVARAFALLFFGVLWKHVVASLARVFVALLIACSTAVPLGVAMGRRRGLDRALSPLAYILYPVPKIALLPIAMLLFGLADASKVTIVFLVLFFQLLVAVRDAARAIPEQYYFSMQSLGAGRLAALRFVTLPALLPQVFAALRIGLGTALAVLFFAETFGTRVGLGYFVMESWMRVAYPEMYAGIVALGITGLALFLGLDALQRRTCRWQSAENSG
jgi:NitT/TauT family transport system permease protein